MKENNAQNQEELIVSLLHDKENISSEMISDLKKSKDFKETKKIFDVKEQVSFLNNLSSEDKFWNMLSSKIKPAKIINIWYRYAAIIVISLIIGGVANYLISSYSNSTDMASFSSPRGQISELTLFDGSKVWLNSESTLSYTKNFNSRKREVTIEGEAYFEVAHNANKPFIVSADQSKIIVHGTSFNVRAYPTDNFVEAVLLEGSIEFDSNNQQTFLKPNEKITFLKSNGSTKIKQTEAVKSVAWKKGKYYYSNETLQTIVQQLKRWYDTDFVISDENLWSYTFTGVINRDKPIGYNLDILELTDKIEFKIENDTILISGKK